MPELPEVETVVRELQAAGIVGQRLDAVSVNWPKIIARPNLTQFKHEILYQIIADLSRRGKFIVIRFESGKHLLIHLRMTGQLVIESDTNPPDKHRHVELRLEDGRWLNYYDTRKFGRFYIVDDPALVTGRLGLEPLSAAFSVTALSERLSKHKRQLKPLLLDQTFIAGLGNIYVDEALFAAGLHPQRLASTLTPTEIAALHKAIRQVLRQGIANQGTSLGNGKGNYARISRRRGRNQERLAVFHRTGQPCPRCGTPIQRIIVAQRSTHFCPRCQPK